MADGDAEAGRRGYRRANAIVLVTLAIMAGWVAAGHGFPGGSLLRRLTGQEGPTGGLTTAMRMMLHGDFAAARARHGAAPWMFAFLVAQVIWRAALLWRRPRPDPLWIADLIASLGLFAAAIYVPWWTR